MTKAEGGEQFCDQFLLGVRLRTKAYRVSTLLLEGVSNLVEEGGVVVSHGLEGVLGGHRDAVRGRGVAGERASLDWAGREASEAFSLSVRLEVNDLVGSLVFLALRQGHLVQGEDIVVPTEEELFTVLGLLSLNLGKELDWEGASSLLKRTAHSLNLVEGEVVVILTVPAENEGVDPRVSLTADSVLGVDGLPRLLPRDSSSLKGLDEAFCEDVGYGDFGGGGHMRGGWCKPEDREG